VEGLVLLHLFSGADGDGITVRSCWNAIMCKITAEPAILCGDGTNDEDCGESSNPLSSEREPKPQLDGPDKSARFTLFARKLDGLHGTK
jgi:hypothetical protein